MDTIALEIHVCDQRRSYRARFATEDQALAFVRARWDTTNHAFHELESEPIPATCVELLGLLYPTCEHGMDLANCYGPQHWYFDEEEQARGLRNGW